MRQFRIYAVSTLGALAGAIAVLAISSRIEMQRANELMERWRRHPPFENLPPGSMGAIANSDWFGPGLFTWFLVVMVSMGLFWLLRRWQER